MEVNAFFNNNLRSQEVELKADQRGTKRGAESIIGQGGTSRAYRGHPHRGRFGLRTLRRCPAKE